MNFDSKSFVGSSFADSSLGRFKERK